MKEKYTKVLKIYGQIILVRKTSFLMKRNISRKDVAFLAFVNTCFLDR